MFTQREAIELRLKKLLHEKETLLIEYMERKKAIDVEIHQLTDKVESLDKQDQVTYGQLQELKQELWKAVGALNGQSPAEISTPTPAETSFEKDSSEEEVSMVRRGKRPRPNYKSSLVEEKILEILREQEQSLNVQQIRKTLEENYNISYSTVQSVVNHINRLIEKNQMQKVSRGQYGVVTDSVE